MPEEQNPNAPNLNTDFEKAHNNEQKQEQEKRDIATKAEAQKLEQERATPTSEHEPTPPGGARYTQEYQQEEIKREERIKYIKERMNDAQQRLREGWDNSRQ